ncbi:MAG: Uma2 family endonuclease [Pyrinomonadaceae bacterium]
MALRAKVADRLTADEYLALEESSEERSEYIDGYVYAMAGGTASHIQISFNLTRIISEKLRGKCRAYQSEMKVRVEDTDTFYYPDVTVVCGEQQFYRGRRDVIENPILLVEVLSESTQEYDKNDKFFAYQKIESFKEYLLISQQKHAVQQYTRQSDGHWKIQASIGIDNSVYLESVELDVPMREIYDLAEIE